ncbi:MAG: Anaerobic ribonucleoside-triphosphate reductase [Spirochaetes bacterium ADurb.Bin110]|nr:MAG: Anaerobic ribonucleoside-triphosphate reductase [Spirochaetes bacterium ADurb.Bin110]
MTNGTEIPSLFGPDFLEWQVVPPIKSVVKRSGEVVGYDRHKIEKAIEKAFVATNTSILDNQGNNKPILYTDLIEKKIKELVQTRHPNSIPAIEEIQDIVETVLIEQRETAVSKAYILYRARHEAIRDTKKLMLDISATMNGYLARSDWRVNENANVNYSLGGLILHNSGSVTANYWLTQIYPKDIAEAHRNADFHIHDLSMFSGYCAGWSLRDLIREGLGGIPDKISSKPASHLSTLANQMVNFLGILQNEWAGAQAFSSFDTYLAPFVRVDNLSDKEIKQSLQSFVFGVNTPSRWGSQAPFTNITLDWTVPEDLCDKPAIVGGKELDFSYGDCRPEMDRINRAFIELMLEGDASGRGFQYPIPTYNVTRDFDWDSPNAKLLFEMTAKYGTPYFQNFINSDLNPADVRSMCCRLRLDKRELRKKGGGLFGADELTGSIGVVTINLPRIGYLSRNEKEFFGRLDELMEKAKRSLVIKRKVIQRLLDVGLFPYTKRYLRTFENHFSTIGIVGMNECLQNFFSPSITTATEEGRDFALELLQYMKTRLADFQEETGDLFNLEATPAESTSYRLAKHDKERYPEIIASGTDEPYYTNSSQLPVGYTSDIFDALDLQEELQTVYTGGTVFHVFLGEAISDWRACAQLVKTIAYSYRIPYFTISPTYSICPVHGYLAGEHFFCPLCAAEERRKMEQKGEKIDEGAQILGTRTEVYSRIVGYYRSVKNWNAGKKAEYKERRVFDPDSKPNERATCNSPVQRDCKAESESPEHGVSEAHYESVEDDISKAHYDGASIVLLFTRKNCPNCPPVRRALAGNVDFEEIDADSQEGMAQASRFEIYSTPTVLVLDENGKIAARLRSVPELKEFFAAQENVHS